MADEKMHGTDCRSGDKVSLLHYTGQYLIKTNILNKFFVAELFYI